MTGYQRLMAEAKREFDAWDAAQKVMCYHIGSTVYVARFAGHPRCACGRRSVRNGQCETCRVVKRASAKPPCACGRAYFAKGLCRPCYFAQYNKTRIRSSRAA